jgi:PHP family Zn ribbon phosphoesterase
MNTIDETIACYCFNPQCTNSIYKYKSTAIIYLSLEKSMTANARCSKCGSLLKSKIDLDIEDQIREVLTGTY